MMKPTDHELLEQYVDGVLAESDLPRLEKLLRTDTEARAALRSLAALDFGLQNLADRENPESATEGESQEFAPRSKDPKVRGRDALKVFAAVLTVIASAILFTLIVPNHNRQGDMNPPSAEQPSDAAIAKVVGLSGPLQWTGDGGRVHYDLHEGMELSGGTVEGLTPNSWFELKFNDGTTVTISGASMLTFSDNGQKELHLKAGGLSSNVTPQPQGKPMIVYTRSAKFEVLGTQFEIETELATTTLNVNEGSVRVERLSDGKTVDVPAKHQVVAAADHILLPLPTPESVNCWKSQLHLGPQGGRGKWSPASDTQAAKIGAIPYTAPDGPTIYTATVVVIRGDKPPVVLQPASRLRVRGRIASPHKTYFGITVRQASGEFAGRFQMTLPQEELSNGQEFEVELPLNDFRLDPSLNEYEEYLPSDPFHLVVGSIWCHTLDKPAGLEIFEVELIPPERESE